jgi:ABC-2 type transport system permease protein
MTGLGNTVSVVRHSLAIGVAELRATYTLQSWVLGWLMRVVFQVLFFALIGSMIGSPERVKFMLVGGAVLAACMEATMVILTAMADRTLGTFSLLVTTSGDYFTVCLGRNLNFLGTGLVTSTVALFLGAAVMGVHLPMPQALLVIPLVALGATTTYMFAAFLGSLTARSTQGYWLSLSITYMTLMALSGFVIPLGFWPQPFVWVAQVLPFTHVLPAIRSMLEDAPQWAFVLRQAGLELLLTLAWFHLGRVACRLTISAARRNGGIDLPV